MRLSETCPFVWAYIICMHLILVDLSILITKQATCDEWQLFFALLLCPLDIFLVTRITPC